MMKNLNTSHVNVNLNIIKEYTQGDINLNTSHVNVNQAISESH